MRTPLEYDFPPSDAIKQLGDILNGSHFVVDGNLILEDERSFNCHFEVGYTKACLIAVIIYLDLPSDANIFEEEKIREAISANRVSKLYGHDRYWNLEVEVNGLQVHTLTSGMSKRLRYSCYAERYEVWADEYPQPLESCFLLVNFSLPYWYSNQAAFESEESTPRFFEIYVSDEQIAKFSFLIEMSKREHNLQPLSILRIQIAQIPSSWNANVLADTICALISLSVGRDVQWTMQHTPRPDGWNISPQRMWVARNIKEGYFYRFIVERFPPLIPDDINLLGTFLSQSLSTLLRKPYEKVAEYIRLLFLYADFANTDSSSHTLQGRLLTSLAEELYEKWGEIEGIHETSTKLVWKPEKRKLIRLFEDLIEEKATQILDRRADENDEEYLHRVTKLKTRIEPIIRDHINDETFERDLIFFFNHYNYQTESNNPLSVYKNIKAFVFSRNSLIHSGCLAHDNSIYGLEQLVTFCSLEDHRRTHEFENILLMLPLMFAAILGYRGQYRKAISVPGDIWCDAPLKNEL